MLVCVYEDRPHQIAGVKLLVSSLAKHCPEWRVWLTCPEVNDRFRAWVSRYPQVRLIEQRLEGSGSFNVKPSVLLAALEAGEEECVWMDTDVIVNGEIGSLLAESAETVVVTQDPWEYASGSSYRAATWGLAVGRDLPGPLNSSVVRVTFHHLHLLKAWQGLTRQPAYLEEQSKPVYLRDGNSLSDQDLLSAVLASEEFSKFPVRRLRHGEEILQHHGAGAYGVRWRWLTFVRGLPPLLHAMGTVKPWQMVDKPAIVTQPRSYYERMYLELSPYVHVARQYRETIEEPSKWMDVQTITGQISRMTSFNHPSFKGMTQAILHQIVYRLKSQVKRTIS